MRDTANIGAVAALHPHYLGFIEYAASARFVGSTFRVPALLPGIRRVGVFVNESIEGIQRRVSEAGYDAVQLHGDESPEFCARMRHGGLQVIKVFRVDDTFDFRATKAYVNNVDQFLFDARGRQPGGNGIRFDMRLLQQYDQEVPFFLSGGLQPDALAEDLEYFRDMNLYGVDLNSGVEQSPGFKDPVKVRAAIGYVSKGS